jgi:cobalamin synthase
VSSDLFWLVATAQVALSIGLVLRLRRVPKPRVSARHHAMANGQRQDSWLACAIVWGVILSKGSDLQGPLCAAGVVVLVWLMVRTSRRLIALSRAMRRHDGG